MGYFIANIGLRDHHKQIDILFNTFIFGLIGLAVFQLATAFLCVNLFSYIGASMLAGIATLGAGVLWRVNLREKFYKRLRDWRIGDTDEIPTAWKKLFDNTKFDGNQLTVNAKNGDIFYCDDLSKFEECAYGPCHLGSDGSVLMYPTHICLKGEDFKENNVIDEFWGAEIVYIPVQEIERVYFRRSPKQ